MPLREIDLDTGIQALEPGQEAEADIRVKTLRSLPSRLSHAVW